jgi:protein TonB
LRRSQPASAGARIRTASIASEGASQSSASLPAWHALVRTRLQALQRYPAEAQAMGQSGTTTVAFVIDRGGRVLSARVAASSGSAVLDQTSVATVRSASLPPPPSDVPGSTFNFSIPLRYRPR